jgi:hypothetical protein
MKFKPFSLRTQLGILLTTGGLMTSSIALGQSTEVKSFALPKRHGAA